MISIRVCVCEHCTDLLVFRIHVRRTDKRSEARYHDLREYMQHVSVFIAAWMFGTRNGLCL